MNSVVSDQLVIIEQGKIALLRQRGGCLSDQLSDRDSAWQKIG
jgi:hypothetical protein